MQNAERMERDADKALIHARAAVKEAREHVKRIEREASEEYVNDLYLNYELSTNSLTGRDLPRSSKRRHTTSRRELDLLDDTTIITLSKGMMFAHLVL